MLAKLVSTIVAVKRSTSVLIGAPGIGGWCTRHVHDP